MALDQDHLDYMLKEISKRKGSPYSLSGEGIADQLFPHVKRIYPEAQMINHQTGEYITSYILVSKRAKTILKKQLKQSKERHLAEIQEIDKVLNEL